MGIFQRSAWYRLMIGDAAAGDAAGGTGIVAPALEVPDAPVLLAYATQTGVAEDFALSTQELLQRAAVPTRVVEFCDLTLDALAAARQALLITSTTCDGDPPDMAEPFCDAYMGQPVDLSRLQYGLLALGDRSYSHFCGFGRQLGEWLDASAAQALFAPIHVDDEDAAALEHWYACVDALIGARQRQAASA